MVRGIQERRRSFWSSSPKREPPRRRRDPPFWLPLALLVVLGAVAYGTTGGLDLGTTRTVEATIYPSGRAAFPLCFLGTRYNCVVDGDTVWINGVKIRIEDIDTPEVSDARPRPSWARRRPAG